MRKTKRTFFIFSSSLLVLFVLISLVALPRFFNSTTLPQAYSQTCTAPATPTGVQVEYPGCSGTDCDLAQASCKWDTQADASSYNLTITEVETSTIVKNNESEPSSTTKIEFPITQGKTYKCDVVAVSACGGLSTAASDQLLCQADAILDTPTPTVIPPTATPIPPTPTIANPGGVVQTVALIGGVLLAIVGGIVLLVL
jgi:hypothetical protein